jgi:hypothetical protein
MKIILEILDNEEEVDNDEDLDKDKGSIAKHDSVKMNVFGFCNDDELLGRL